MRNAAAVALFGLMIAPLWAGPGEPSARAPRLVLALSGGGARGVAHIGVLRAFEEGGLVIDGIAGTSMGAMVGALYASGYRAADLERIFEHTDWAGAFSGRTDRRSLPLALRDDDAPALIGLGFDQGKIRLPAAALSDYEANRFLIRHLSAASYAAGGDFHRLGIPFEAIATALDNGERVVLASGSLPLAVRASASIPLAFAPVDWNGRPLVDGGLVDNLPVAAARSLGADVVVAVDVRTPPFAPSQYEDLVGIANQVTNILARAKNLANAAPADVVVTPDLGRRDNGDYSDLGGLIRLGYEAGLRALPSIRAKIASTAVEAAEVPGDASPGPEERLAGTRIATVEVLGNRACSHELIRRFFDLEVGRPFDLETALLALDKLQATSLFDWTWMNLEPAPGSAGLRVTLSVRERPRTRLEAGAAFNEPERFKAFVRVRQLNPFGSGERLDLVLQGSDALAGGRASLQGERIGAAWLGYRLEAFALDDKPRVFESGRELNRARFARRGVSVLFRASVERSAQLEAGFLAGRVETQARTGLPFGDGLEQLRTLVAAIDVDTLDDSAEPESGARIALRAERGLRSLGGSASYWRTRAQLRFTRRIGERAGARLDLESGLSGGALPRSERFRIGGPFLLPGWHADELWGAQAAAAALSGRVRLAGKLHGVARAGLGNVWERRRDIRLAGLSYGFGLGLSHPSRLGPLTLDVGIRDGGSTLVSVSIGYP